MWCRTKGCPFRPHPLYNDERHPATSVGDRNNPPFRSASFETAIMPSCSSVLMKRSKLRGGDYGHEKGSHWSPGWDSRSHVSSLWLSVVNEQKEVNYLYFYFFGERGLGK
ncbi:hypothetical protein AVEN_85500-1 [Araneus ventricosus]|uniref:Uncharacterized protein n=1 Tax=Araneus ventricosus TaxID=182803 RepID=A0A4Y2GWY7_ARAVE|nr:hypothetical protein AVEN_85500-1 [Araneus ventricosus]